MFQWIQGPQGHPPSFDSPTADSCFDAHLSDRCPRPPHVQHSRKNALDDEDEDAYKDENEDKDGDADEDEDEDDGDDDYGDEDGDGGGDNNDDDDF